MHDLSDLTDEEASMTTTQQQEEIAWAEYLQQQLEDSEWEYEQNHGLNK